MAWVIGIASREEREAIEKAGYEVDEGVVDGVEIPDEWCGVWVDCTLIELLDAPEHEKAKHRAGSRWPWVSAATPCPLNGGSKDGE